MLSQLPSQLYIRFTPDASQAQHDACIRSKLFKLSHYTAQFYVNLVAQFGNVYIRSRARRHASIAELHEENVR